MRVLRIYHAGLVPAWRARERELRRLGVEVELLTARRWPEVGAMVALQTGTDPAVRGAATLGRHPLAFIYSPREVWRAVRSGDFDVVDIHEEPASLAAAEVLLLLALDRRGGRRRPKVCLYSAQNIAKRYPPPFRWLEKWALGRADAIHTCNEAAGDILVAKGFRGRPVNLGLGVDRDLFEPDDESRCSGSESRLRVGFVGRLEIFKGIDVLLDAVDQVSGLQLVMVGDGSGRPLVERAARAGGGDRVVEHRGFVEPAELGAVYRTLDVLVVPSIDTPSWREQFGRVVVEAMAAGVPVVASSSGALPEVVGEAGLLVPPGDAQALAGVLERLRDDPEERSRYAALGIRRARHYSWPEVARRHLALYEEIAP